MLARGINVALGKATYTVGVIFICNLLFSIKYPGILCNCDFDNDSTSLIAATEITSLLSQTVKPYIMSNIVMHLLAMSSKYFEKMRKDPESQRSFDMLTILVMTSMSLAYSGISVKHLDKYISLSCKSIFFIYYSIINVVVSLFVAWFNRQMLLNGVGHGISIILSLKIVNMYLQKYDITSVYEFFKIVSLYDYIYFMLCFMFVVLMDKLSLKLKIVALSDKNSIVDKNHLVGYIEYEPNRTTVLAAILTMQTTNLFNAISKNNIPLWIVYWLDVVFNSYGVATTIVMFIFKTIVLFIFNYIYNYVSNPHTYKLNESLRKNLCAIPYVRPGEDTNKFVDSVVLRCSLISVSMIAGYLLVPLILQNLLPCKIVMQNGIDIMIVASSLMKIIEYLISIYKVNSGDFNYSRLIVK